MRKQILLIFFVAASLFGSAQITGKVITVSSDAKKEPLPGANIYWQGTQTGTSSDESGEFSINKVESTSLLIVTYVGFKSDTVNVKKVNEVISPLYDLGFTEDEVKDRWKNTPCMYLDGFLYYTF